MSDMKTTFSDAVMSAPTSAGDHQGLSGGYPIENDGPGGQGLVSSPYRDGICGTPGGRETRSSELGTTPTLTDVKDAPAGQPSGMSGIGILGDHTTDQTFKTGK